MEYEERLELFKISFLLTYGWLADFNYFLNHYNFKYPKVHPMYALFNFPWNHYYINIINIFSCELCKL